MNRIEKTADLHQNGGMTCSQALLTVFGPAVGLDGAQAKILGRPLCGINLGKFGVCGYISSAALVLGLFCNHTDEAQARRAANQSIDKLCLRFKAQNGHLRCKHLLGADWATAEGQKAIKENNLIAKHCYGYGRDVAAILDELLHTHPAPTI